MLCPNCRQEIEAGSEFCGNCGARIEHHPVELTCPACGNSFLPGAEFCAECGTRLSVETVPAQAFCSECGATVKQGVVFCRECGARLGDKTTPVQSVCPGCGEPLDPQAAFCGNCGRILQQGAKYASAAPETAATENRLPYQRKIGSIPNNKSGCNRKYSFSRRAGNRNRLNSSGRRHNRKNPISARY